jgi:hypothetical protein
MKDVSESIGMKLSGIALYSVLAIVFFVPSARSARYQAPRLSLTPRPRRTLVST